MLSVNHNAGLGIRGVTCAFTNFSYMKILCCKFEDVKSYKYLRSWINHPVF